MLRPFVQLVVGRATCAVVENQSVNPVALEKLGDSCQVVDSMVVGASHLYVAALRPFVLIFVGSVANSVVC